MQPDYINIDCELWSHRIPFSTVEHQRSWNNVRRCQYIHNDTSEMTNDHQKSQRNLAYIVRSQVHSMNGTLSLTTIGHLAGTLSSSIHPTNHSTNLSHAHSGFNYPLYIGAPVGAAVLILLLVLLILLIRRSLRKRQLRRDLLPHYGYDHSEAEVFDGYTQFSDGQGSTEKLSQDSRSKTMSPDSTGKSLSLEPPHLPYPEDRLDGSSTPKEFMNSLSV